MAPSGDERVAPDESETSSTYGPVVEISEIKLHPPAARPEWIDRPRLLQRLGQASGSPVVLISAPAGYG